MIFIDELKKFKEKNKYKIKMRLQNSSLSSRDRIINKLKQIKTDRLFTSKKLNKSNTILKINQLCADESILYDSTKLVLKQKIVDNLSVCIEDSFVISIREIKDEKKDAE